MNDFNSSRQNQDLYIERDNAKEFFREFDRSLQAEQSDQNNPCIFHIYGLGGVGKTTITRRIQKDFSSQGKFLSISFGLTDKISNPLEVMETFHKLFSELPKKNLLLRDVKELKIQDTFQIQFDRYYQGIKKLETTTVDGKKGVDEQQIALVKNLKKYVSPITSFWQKVF